ncbi:YfbU family protein [uncultured Hyphomonas sp.]|uniref:YfbU family protein n=1 Tax=uncultured Hyphomonas sp. TaxID=225298 RepID=UPI002AAA67D9|nr:YfbU family protein [uncultured Hyphomonas sp.]
MATISFRIDDQTKARLDRLVEERALNPSAVFRQALDLALNNIEFGTESRRAMKLTLPDRLKLANQYEILTHLDPERAAEYQAYVLVLKQGFDIQYAHLAQDFSDGLSDGDCAEVLRILDMFSILKAMTLNSDEPLPDAWLAASLFKGFHENSEHEQHLFARYLIYDLDHYKSVRADVERFGLSATFPMLPRYRQMLNIWQECHNPFNPTWDEFSRIVKSGWRPDHHD